jgi:hypothetical protein
LSAEQLLAGGSLSHQIDIPAELLVANGSKPEATRVVLRPLTVRDLQLIGKAAQQDDNLSAALMIQRALVDPALKPDQVSKLPAGVARFLVAQINRLSGIDTPRDELADLVQAPLARACFILAREFGWTPEEVSGMTIGQILLYLEMSHQHELGRELGEAA